MVCLQCLVEGGGVDRFGQIEPKILIAADGYYYNGKTLDCLDKVRAVQPQLKGLQKTIIVPFISENPDLSGLQDTVTAGDSTAPFWAGGGCFYPSGV